ncbi:unnamed protein product [Phytophthora fragariaefolia]|uniref:Unnamed protein product n=1 Tax=Phytophthora fragariaefolia TaxID=1490495 RepID=A0A9W6Y4I8_9STRA|nr:unnamed protein product [Phytophthora fragariaefolia]
MTPPATTLQVPADVAMESVSSQSTPRSKRQTRDQDEDPEDLFDMETRTPGTAAAVSTATALSKNVRRSWTDLTDQFRIQYCCKGVSMASRYYHASKHADETPLEYLYRLNVAAMRAKMPYADGTAEERREHVELFINTLGSQEQEQASRLTLMELPNASVLEKKLRARQRGLVHQKKTLFGTSKLRQKAPASPAPPPRAVHAIHATTDGYDSGRESCDSEDVLYDQDRDEDDRAKMFVTGQTPPGEPARREAGSDDAGRDRPTC